MKNTKYTKKADKFWNNSKTIKWFSDYPFSDYWMETFSGIKHKDKTKILDLGCGGGRNAAVLAGMGFGLYCCDYYDGMVKKTRERLIACGFQNLANNRIAKSHMRNLPYKNETFDIVLAHGVYHNAISLEEFNESVKESARVLKRNGKILFNFFTSGYIGKDLRRIPDSLNLYLTKDDLLMVLTGRDEFEQMSKDLGLDKEGPIIEYRSKVTSGIRSVMRGVLKKP